jgi:hypothetical protein
MVPDQGDEALRSMPSIPEYLVGGGAMGCGASQSEPERAGERLALGEFWTAVQRCLNLGELSAQLGSPFSTSKLSREPICGSSGVSESSRQGGVAPTDEVGGGRGVLGEMGKPTGGHRSSSRHVVCSDPS